MNPQSLLSWQRVTIANRFSEVGKNWSSIFSMYNSGTYNNQWIIVDYHQWQSGGSSDILWIAEQIPGQVVSGDETKVLLTQGYWPSYNIPYFPSIYNVSGYSEMLNKYGDWFSYDKCPRANIFRRNQTLVHTFDDLKDLMRFNNFQHDPLSFDRPDGAIAARMDLASQNPSPFGGIDSKVTSLIRVAHMDCDAICGPTATQQTPFSWENWSNWSHVGLPDVWNFNWQTMQARFQ